MNGADPRALAALRLLTDALALLAAASAAVLAIWVLLDWGAMPLSEPMRGLLAAALFLGLPRIERRGSLLCAHALAPLSPLVDRGGLTAQALSAVVWLLLLSAVLALPMGAPVLRVLASVGFGGALLVRLWGLGLALAGLPALRLLDDPAPSMPGADRGKDPHGGAAE